MHVIAYNGPDLEKYTKNIKNIDQEVINKTRVKKDKKNINNLVSKRNKDTCLKNLNKNTESLGKSVVYLNHNSNINLNSNLHTYHLNNGDRRGKYLKDMNLDLQPTGIAKVKASLNDCEMIAILDSGANVSFISNETALNLKLNIEKHHQSKKVTGYGSEEAILGQVKIRIQFVNKTIYHCTLQVM